MLSKLEDAVQSIVFALLVAVQQRKVKWYHDNDREPQEQNISCLPRLQFSRTSQNIYTVLSVALSTIPQSLYCPGFPADSRLVQDQQLREKTIAISLLDPGLWKGGRDSGKPVG